MPCDEEDCYFRDEILEADEVVYNARKLNIPESRGIDVPAQGSLPFTGRITREDLDLLKFVEVHAEGRMRRLASNHEDFDMQLALLAKLHHCIDQGEIDLHQERFWNAANKQRVAQAQVGPMPLLFMPVDVMDLEKAERKCHICKEFYLSPIGEDRKEEKPCRLPCTHVFGHGCIRKHFRDLAVNCPICKRAFDPRE
jgi:Zinc finger, C3HC4 type (RING finger)